MKFNALKFLSVGLLSTVAMTSCDKDDDIMNDQMDNQMMMQAEFGYDFNNGQVVSSAYYQGNHSDNLTAKMLVEELPGDSSQVTITLMNTIEGEMYHVHAHDAADASMTPNGTPYNETPNGDLFSKHAMGNGGMVMIMQKTAIDYNEILNNYEGFLVVHDPLQDISTTDISTYLIVGGFARENDNSNLMSNTFNYDFNTGQVAQTYAYTGTHSNSLMAKLKVQELSNGSSRISVWLMNTINDEMYHIHAHDAADASTTPNGTPYDETPNAGLLSKHLMGNGETVLTTQVSMMSYADITANYSGFFVIHDPLQPISTVDPTTYVILGSFAR